MRKAYAERNARRLPGLGERLREAVDSLRSRKYAAEDVMEVSVDALARYLRDENEPTFRAIARLALHAGYSMEWLATGTGVKQTSIAEPSATIYGELVVVPRLEDGMPAIAIARSWLKRHGLEQASLAAMEAHGLAMQGRLADGDLVLLDRDDTDIRSGCAYGLRMNGELLVRYLQRLPAGRMQVIGTDGERFPSYVVEKDDWSREAEIIGRVCAHCEEWN